MIVTTMERIPGYRVVEVLGLVQGSSIRARNVGHDIVASIKNLTGGEITEYTKLMAEAREQCLDRMRESAAQRGANAVVAMRFATTEVMTGAAELLAYGTAVRVEAEES